MRHFTLKLTKQLLLGSSLLFLAACDDADSKGGPVEDVDSQDGLSEEDTIHDGHDSEGADDSQNPGDQEEEEEQWVFLACADEAGTDDEELLEQAPVTTGGDGIITDHSAVSTQAMEGFFRTHIDASDGTSWTYFSFETQGLVIPEPEGNEAYDLGFQRFLIDMPEGMEVVMVEGQAEAFARMKKAPKDACYEEKDISTAETGMEYPYRWWTYDFGTHQLAANQDLFFLFKTKRAYYKVRFRDYYDEGGTPGFITFDWAEIESPEDTQ